MSLTCSCTAEANVAEGGRRGLQDEGERLPVQLDPKEKMTYTMQASKRTHCQRLTSFIRLCDFIVVNMLHQFSAKSYSVLLERLQDQVTKTVEIVDLVTSPKKVDGEEDDDEVEIPRIPTNVTSPRVREERECTGCHLDLCYIIATTYHCSASTIAQVIIINTTTYCEVCCI